MNQKDYKAIAEIIHIEINNSYEGSGIRHLTTLSLKLANYFENEKHRCSCEKGFLAITPKGQQEHCFCNNCKDDYYRDVTFNKNQFLKDCGVE